MLNTDFLNLSQSFGKSIKEALTRNNNNESGVFNYIKGNYRYGKSYETK